MKSKQTAPSRRKISFAVDRDDIDVNSDWVEAVMALPVAATVSAPSTSKTTPVSSESSLPEESTVENKASGEDLTPVPQNASGPNNSTEGQEITEKNIPHSLLNAATQAALDVATVEANTPRLRRVPRRRILNRITDGLTPGQYAVYRVMYEEGESSQDRAHIYCGGYADLGRLTGMSKRGIQNVVGELQAKDVIHIHRKPGHHRTETSAYIVPDADRVLETWLSKGWRYAVGKSKALTP